MTSDEHRTAKGETLPPLSEPPRKPPVALMKYLVNPLMKVMLRSPLHGRVSEVLALLTFKGRKSGKLITTPVSYHRAGKDILIFTHSKWSKNFQEGLPATMVVAGQTLEGMAEATRDREAIFAELEPLLRTHGMSQASRLGVALREGSNPSPEEIKGAIEAQGLVMIRFRPGGG